MFRTRGPGALEKEKKLNYMYMYLYLNNKYMFIYTYVSLYPQKYGITNPILQLVNRQHVHTIELLLKCIARPYGQALIYIFTIDRLDTDGCTCILEIQN